MKPSSVFLKLIAFKVISTALFCGLITFVSPIATHSLPNPEGMPDSQRESFIATMRRIAADFETLSPLLASAERFSNPSHKDSISVILERLRDNFLLILPGTAIDPAYDISLYSIRDVLSDASFRFNAGKTEYARWRLRSLTTHCVSCHSRFSFGEEYKAGVKIEEQTKGYSNLELGEYYLATRQFEQAKEAFLSAATDKSLNTLERMDALRKLLLTSVRLENNPRETLSLFTKLEQKLNLPTVQSHELQQWLHSLRRWLGESRTNRITEFRKAEALIQQYAVVSDESGLGQVELLRASAILHRLLSTPSEELDENFSRARALYLLGNAYEQMPLFFSLELPEFYYEECISEYPGTLVAQNAYRKYYDLALVNYTGSGGSDIPTEVRSKLQVLFDRAFNNKE